MRSKPRSVSFLWRHCRQLAAGACALLGTAVVLLAAVGSANATPVFNVVDVEDAPDAAIGDGTCASTHLGLCTLRAAIMEAEAEGGGIVTLATNTGLGDYQLTIPSGSEASIGSPARNATGDLDISTNIRVDGGGPESSVIAGNGSFRIFDVHKGGTLWLRGVTVQNGRGEIDGRTNHEHGGAIHNHGSLTLADVAVIGSSTPAGWGGGGITNASGATAQLSNVTVARNSTSAQGGGIENLGELHMLNVTVAENTAPAGQGGGVFDSGSPWNTADALVASNAGGDCRLAGTPAVNSTGGNFAGDASCGFTATTDGSGDPEFDTTRFGPPLYYPLQRSSPAVDVLNLCQYDDIRGVLRPLDGDGTGQVLCDSGSFEREAPAPDSLAADDARVGEGNVPPKQAQVVVLAPQGLSHSATVWAQTQDGTAHAGSDYVAKKQQLKLGTGTTKVRFAVDLLPDTQLEPNETFKVQLSSASGATIDDGEAVVTIVNDD
jgi:hypothetical protein